jgi:hypothetical protein
LIWRILRKSQKDSQQSRNKEKSEQTNDQKEREFQDLKKNVKPENVNFL